MRKKSISLLWAGILILGLFGCGNGKVEGPAINGVSLSKYAIVYSEEDTDYALRAAEYIQAQIKERTGLELLLQEDSAVTAKYEIVVGDTQRDISAKLDAETGKNSFAIMATKKQVALEGDYFLIAAAAYYFVETYITQGAFNAQIPAEATICQPITQAPNNYIVLIGDGMGFNHTKLFENAPVDLNISEGFSDKEDIFYGYLFPAQGSAHTNSLTGTTDSAAAGTALATGYKTYNRYIGMNGNGDPVKSLTELANELGKATAVLSTDSRSGATPSTFSAHAADRGDTNIIMESQGVIEKAGTIISCDYNVFEKRKVEKQIEGTVLETLAKLEQDEDGFFMMYEEAHIDKYSSANNLNQAFMAVARFNQVIGIIMEYAYYNPDTFVLITADHETGDLQPTADGRMQYNSEDHTHSDVPVFAYGQGSELFDGIAVENVQIPKTIAKFWGVADFGDPETPGALQ